MTSSGASVSSPGLVVTPVEESCQAEEPTHTSHPSGLTADATDTLVAPRRPVRTYHDELGREIYTDTGRPVDERLGSHVVLWIVEDPDASNRERPGSKCAPYCPTDVVTFRDPRGLQIDHVVPLKEVNRSRLRGSGPAGESALGPGRVWSAAEKHAFAEDQENLVAVTASVNEAKGALDPGHWKPADESQWCWYGRTYTHIKAQYGLSVDPAELAGLRQLLPTCPTDDHNQPGGAR